MRIRMGLLLCALAAGILGGVASPASAGPRIGGADLGWAWPAPPNQGDATFSTQPSERLPGVPGVHSPAELHNLFGVVDWRPGSHPPMPPSVRAGRLPEVRACGFCHMPNGAGRPENAVLAGLPAAYIRQQLADMQAGTRQGLVPDWRPVVLMHRIAGALTRQEASSAADYFSRLRLVSRVRVVEAATVPAVSEVVGVYRFAADGRREAIGQRILEGPDSFERFELRDDTVTYTAWVPPGALARGAKLARSGTGPNPQACVTCHGAGLRGGPTGPPLAGRSPTGMVRQIAALATGARHGRNAAPMQRVAQGLTADQMIDVAAYAASLKP